MKISLKPRKAFKCFLFTEVQVYSRRLFSFTDICRISSQLKDDESFHAK